MDYLLCLLLFNCFIDVCVARTPVSCFYISPWKQEKIASRKRRRRSLLATSHQEGQSPAQQKQQHKHKRARIPILQYHDDWVCINKPPGITVHRSKNTPKHTRVLTTSVKRQLSRKVFPVHRLDHRTSGALLLAFDSEMAGKLHDAAIRKGQKQYLALLRGEWKYPEASMIVDRPLKVQNDIVKEAKTNFTVLATSRGQEIANDDENGDGKCTLVLCQPLTGRTHQIRRHARELGHPVLGDSQHGNSRANRFWRQHRGLDRLALHCWMLKFDMNGEKFECVAPVPSELRQSLEKYAPDLWDAAVQKEPELLMEEYDEKSGTHGRYFRQRQDDISA